jgi:V8-like Glu-specific endopeptidase|tara:strand:+ start:484 stop:798 length:315 start_codon:yes stop_codon:yes gene_type:complete
MAITNFQVGTGTGSAAFTASASTAITAMYITNKSSSDGNVDVYVVPSGSTVNENFKVYNTLLVPAQDTYVIHSEKLILETGDKIYIAAPDSSAQFNATISTIGL